MAPPKKPYSICQIAERAGFHHNTLYQIVKCSIGCTVEKAYLLEAITGIPKETWVFNPEELRGELKKLQASNG